MTEEYRRDLSIALKPLSEMLNVFRNHHRTFVDDDVKYTPQQLDLETSLVVVLFKKNNEPTMIGRLCPTFHGFEIRNFYQGNDGLIHLSSWPIDIGIYTETKLKMLSHQGMISTGTEKNIFDIFITNFKSISFQ